MTDIRQNQYSKLRKAIRDNNKFGMIHAMMALPILARHPARARKAVTRGNYIKNEINRALSSLKQDGNWSPQLKEAFEIVRNHATEQVWNEAIYKAPENNTVATPEAPTTETPVVNS